MRIFIQKLLDRVGSWITRIGYTRKYRIKTGDVVMDVGAYLGHFAIYASKLVGPAGRVFAYEPDPINFRIMEKEVGKSGLSNIVLVKKGLYSSSATLKLKSAYSKSRMVTGRETEKKNLDVECTTLDEEVSRLALPKIDFIKMDIEGMELEFFEGAKKSFDKINHLAIASYHYRHGQRTRDILAPKLRALGYQVSAGFIWHRTLYADKMSITSYL